MDNEQLTIEFIKTQERIANHLENNTNSIIALSDGIREKSEIDKQTNQQNHEALQEIVIMAKESIQGKNDMIANQSNYIKKLEKIALITTLSVIILLGGFFVLEKAVGFVI